MKCALIGLGMVSKTYGDAIAKCETVDLSLVYARSPDAREAFLSDWPQLNARAASNVDEIAASDVDFVILTTPPNARSEIVETLAAAGKPILMEKPVERTLEAATALVERCEAAGVPLSLQILGWLEKDITADQIREIAGLATYPLVGLMSAAQAMQDNYAKLMADLNTGDLPHPVMSMGDFKDFIGFEEIENQQEKFLLMDIRASAAE
mgnify:CR=1 FL=1